jgi:hypothetical protein
MSVSITRIHKRWGPRPSDRVYLASHCSRSGIRATHKPLYAVANYLLCEWCHHQWQKLFNSRDEEGRLLLVPGTRFIEKQDEAA